MDFQASIALIKANLAEVLNPEIIDRVVLEENRPFRVYWGTATTGRPHCGYFVPIVKIAELLRAGCAVTILLADMHAYLDNMKAPLELVELRAQYYERVVRSLLRAVGVEVDMTSSGAGLVTATAKASKSVPAPAPKSSTTTTNSTSTPIAAAPKANSASAIASTPQIDPRATPNRVGYDLPGLRFVKGSSYQLSATYTLDRFKLEGITRLGTAQRAGAEVVKQADDPYLGGLVYPLMQALDEEYLGVDCQFGGVDQRKIFIFALEKLPRIGYRVRAHLMNAMVPGLGEAQKMSSSEPDSKIDLLDSADVVAKKLRKAVCAPKVVEGNGVLAFVEHVIMRVLSLRGDGAEFVVERRDAEPLEYTDVAKLRADYELDVSLKAALTRELNALLDPIRADFAASADWQDISERAYPPEEKPKIVKKEKAKDRGDPAKRAAALARKAELKVKQEAEAATAAVASTRLDSGTGGSSG